MYEKHYETKTTEYFETLHSGKTKKVAKPLRNVKVQRMIAQTANETGNSSIRDEIENMLPNTERNRNYSNEL